LAISAASPGDTVLVAPGTYTGSGNRGLTPKSAMTIRSERGPSATIIDCEYRNRAFFFEGYSNEALVAGFTIRHGADPPIGWYGAGVVFWNCTAEIQSCIIEDGEFVSEGGGIACWGEGHHPRITNCIIRHNQASKGAAIYAVQPSVTIENCLITQHSSDSLHFSGVPVALGSGAKTLVSGCAIVNNQSHQQAAGLEAGDGSIRLHNTVVMDNTLDPRYAYSAASALFLSGSAEVEASNCVFAANRLNSYAGGAIMVRGRAELNATNCTVADNECGRGTSIVCAKSGVIRLENMIVRGAGDSVLVVQDDAELSATYSNIESGWPGLGNVDLDPDFLTFAGMPYLLHPLSSPCIDTGNPAIEDDIYDWHPRWPARFENDAHSDMGAYGGPDNRSWAAFFQRAELAGTQLDLERAWEAWIQRSYLERTSWIPRAASITTSSLCQAAQFSHQATRKEAYAEVEAD